MEPWVSTLQSGLHYVCTDKILKVKCVMCVFFSALRRSESPCQTTKWWERRQQVRGETWSERSHASWPRPEKLRASSKTTSLPSHVSLFLQRASVFQKSVLMCSSLVLCVHVCLHESLLYLHEFWSLCCQWSQRDQAPSHISVPSCPQSWNCRLWRRRTPLSRTTRRTARTQQETPSL